jgi:hypothetical protein
VIRELPFGRRQVERALVRLRAAMGQGKGDWAPVEGLVGLHLEGELEVRNADGTIRRMQRERLLLPRPLADAFSLPSPRANLEITLGDRTLTLWAPSALIELQVGYRWNGFSGKKLGEWDERFVVFAEDGGDPVAMRTDEEDGQVWTSPRGEGRPVFSIAAPSLAVFYESLASWIEAGPSARSREGLPIDWK